MALAPFPVPQKYVASYGRGRTYFPRPVEFTVPLLCAVRLTTTFYYYITDVAPEWENWKLAVPQSPKNHILCYAEPLDVTGKPIKDRVPSNGYLCCTVAELRRRIPTFWRQSLVLMEPNIWLPMETADPYNLLGFTCLPRVRTVDVNTLPVWSNSADVAVSVVKPMYVPTPFSVHAMMCYQDVPIDVATLQTALPSIKEPVETAFDFTRDPEVLSLEQIKQEPTIAHLRDYLRVKLKQKKASRLHILAITEVYYQNSENTAYLCHLKNTDTSVWISEGLLDCLDICDATAFSKYQAALKIFERKLSTLAASQLF